MATSERLDDGYTDEELIEQLLEANSRVDGSITVKGYHGLNDTDPESYGPYETNFGTWNNAKRAAGLRLHDFPRDERLLSGEEYYRALKEQLDCVVCGESFPGAINLHHPEYVEKGFDVSHHGRSARNMKHEAEKCISLCANCHHKHHSDNHELNADGMEQIDAPSILKDKWN